MAGTLLTMKDRFLTQAQYSQLLYECIAPDCSGAWEVWMDAPAVLKPRRLWTGKQAFTAVLMHYTRDQLPFTLCADSKVPLDMWGKQSGEGRMHVWRNHLVAGCVDKASFGKHGLLHVFYVSRLSCWCGVVCPPRRRGACCCAACAACAAQHTLTVTGLDLGCWWHTP